MRKIYRALIAAILLAGRIAAYSFRYEHYGIKDCDYYTTHLKEAFEVADDILEQA